VASRHPELVPTFVVHRYWLTGCAILLLTTGVGILGWIVARPQFAVGAQVGPGLLRPRLLIVAVPAGYLAISESQISQGELVRGLEEVPLRAISTDVSRKPCPAAFHPEAAATCVSRGEIARYANSLTSRENAVRGATLTNCYGGFPPFKSRKDCTGYRLPTLAEWKFQKATPKPPVVEQYPRLFSASGREIVDDGDAAYFAVFDGYSTRVLDGRDPGAHFRVVRDFR
jgi:hypothetical protein